jgi:hypothetical protein
MPIMHETGLSFPSTFDHYNGRFGPLKEEFGGIPNAEGMAM